MNTLHNKTQLQLRNDYINIVKEKARHRKKVMTDMNKFLSKSSAQGIMKVCNIQTQQSECVQRKMVLEGDTIDNYEALPQDYSESNKEVTDSLTGTTPDLDWMKEE